MTTSKNEMDLIKAEDIQAAVQATTQKPQFPRIQITEVEQQQRKVKVPVHRMPQLKKNWEQIYTPIVEKLNLQVRMNVKTQSVEVRTCEYTSDNTAIQKAADFLQAFMFGFEVADALALLRLDDIYLDSFEVKDVKSLSGDHLGRAIGRIAGKNGAVKFTIENATKTRIVVADSKIYMLGSFKNIQLAKNAVVDLILGSPPGQVYNKLRVIASRMKESF